MYDFEEDRREANRILRAWIADKTGTTGMERAIWRTATTWGIIREKMQASIVHVTDMLTQASPDAGYEQQFGVKPSTHNN